MNGLEESTINLDIDSLIQSKTSSSLREFNIFLSAGNFITEKGDKDTNIIDQGARKTYRIPAAAYEEFFTLLEKCRRDKLVMHWSEKQVYGELAYSGIVIDFDRIQKTKNREITNQQFDLLMTRIAKILAGVLDLRARKEPYHIFITRKPQPVVKAAAEKESATVYKDGFHVIIPEIQVTKSVKKYIHDELRRLEKADTVFKCEHIEPPEKMIDDGSARNPILFYGSCKRDGNISYELVHACAVNMHFYPEMLGEPIIADAGYRNVGCDIERSYFDVKILDNYNICYELSLSISLAEIAAPIDRKKTLLVKSHYEPHVHLSIKIETAATFGHAPKPDVEEDAALDVLARTNAEIAHMKALLEILDPSYCREYDKWFKVLCAIAHTSTRYKPLAQWFSMRDQTKYSAEAFERTWEHVAATGHNSPITKRSLMFWARESSPNRFAKVNNDNYVRVLANYVFMNDGSVEHAMVAHILHLVVGTTFVCDLAQRLDSKYTYCWYEFITPGKPMEHGEIYKWRQELEPGALHLYLSNQMDTIFREVHAMIKDRLNAAANDVNVKYLAAVEKNFKKYITKLHNNTFQNGCISQAQWRFKVHGFARGLDSYEDVFGVGNGILKLGAKTQLISGFHEYKISKYTSVDYYPLTEARQRDPIVQELLAAIHQIFIEPDVCDFVIYQAATGLVRYDVNCVLLMLTGGGKNGKSFWLELIENTLGEKYARKVRMQLLTDEPEDASKPNSAKMILKGLNWAYADETGQMPRLNTMALKMLVNPGKITSRDLHAKEESFRMTANLVTASNYDFEVETTDHGTWRRLFYYRNKVKFTDKPDPSNPYEKLNNPKYKRGATRNDAYLQAMLSILVYYYEKFVQLYDGELDKVPVPTIKHETAVFRNRQDSINRFITCMLVKSDRDVLIEDVANKYLDWVTKTRGRTNRNVQSVIEQFENSSVADHLQTRNSNRFLTGVRIKEKADEPLKQDESPYIKLLTAAADEEAGAPQYIITQLLSN